MEILKSVKQDRRAPIAAAVIALALLVAATAVFSVFVTGADSAAEADNSSQIGAGGGTIGIEDVTPYEGAYGGFYNGGLWNTDSGGAYFVQGGIKYRVTFPAYAEKVYVAYDLDLNMDVWGIRGEHVIDGIPYMLHDGTEGNNRDYTDVFGNSTIATGELYPICWTGIKETADGDNRKYFEVTLGVTGELMIYVELGGGGETMSIQESQIVNSIDYRHPEPVYDSYGRLMSGILSTDENGERSYSVRVKFTDNFPAGVPYSACSGITGIWILRFDSELTTGDDGTDESIDPDELEGYLKEHTVQKIDLTHFTLQRDYSFVFNIVEDGYYYYFVMDAIANSALGALSDGKIKIQTNPAYDITGYFPSGKPTTLNVEEFINDCSVMIAENAPDGEGDKINADLYDRLVEEYANLTLAFRDGTDRDTLTELYWAFYNGVYSRAYAAVTAGKGEGVLSVANNDLMEGVSFSADNLSDAVDSVGGDSIELKLNLALLPEGSGTRAGVLAAADCEGSVIRLSFVTELNGAALSDDKLKNKIVLRMDFDPGSEYVVVYGNAEGGFSVADFVNGTGFMIFEPDGLSGDIYLVEKAAPTGGGNALWISLGAVGFVVVICVILFVLYKKGIIRKKNKREIEEPENDEDETQTKL